MLKRFLKSIFGDEPPAPPILEGNFTHKARRDPRFLAAHPEWAQWRPGMPHPSGARPAPPPPPPPKPYHAAVPSTPQPAVATSPAALLQAVTAMSQQAPAAINAAQGMLSSLASTSATVSASVDPSSDGDSAMQGEVTLRRSPDGGVKIDRNANGDMGAEGDVDFEGLGNAFGTEEDGLYNPFGPTEGSTVEYHISRMDAFGPTHSPYNFGLEGEPMVETEGMPTGPIGEGPGSFGFDDEFYDGFGPAMIFGDEDGCDSGIKG